MRNLKWKWLSIFIVIALALWQLHYSWVYFSLDKEKIRHIPPDKLEFIESRALHLGLDLQGGMHLVLEVDKSALEEEEIKGAADRALHQLSLYPTGKYSQMEFAS